MHLTSRNGKNYAYLSSWAYVPSITEDTIQELWGQSCTISRTFISAPEWTEYMSKDGTIMSKTGLYAEWLFKAIDTYGEKHVANIVDIDPDSIWECFENYIKGSIFAGERVRLVD